MGWGDQPTLLEGQTAPDVPLTRLDGSVVRLSELAAEGPVLLAFYKDTCPVCQLTLPYLNRIRDGRLKVLAIGQDDPARAGRFAREWGIEYETLIDPADRYEASNAFGITHVPAMFAVDAKMKINWASSGFVKVDLEGLEELAGMPVLTAADNVPAAKPG
jgi:peroxiredoxin